MPLPHGMCSGVVDSALGTFATKVASTLGGGSSDGTEGALGTTSSAAKKRCCDGTLSSVLLGGGDVASDPVVVGAAPPREIILCGLAGDGTEGTAFSLCGDDGTSPRAAGMSICEHCASATSAFGGTTGAGQHRARAPGASSAAAGAAGMLDVTETAAAHMGVLASSRRSSDSSGCVGRVIARSADACGCSNLTLLSMPARSTARSDSGGFPTCEVGVAASREAPAGMVWTQGVTVHERRGVAGDSD